MTRKEELIDALQRSFDGPVWHGPSLEEALADVTAEEASYRPAADVHTIRELVLHAAAWAGEVANRLDGNPPGEPAQGDWPESDLNEGWEDAVQQVFSARDDLLAAIRDQSEADLDLLVGIDPDPPLGTGSTRCGMVLGLIQHNAYHGGQILLIKKILRADALHTE